MFSYCTIIMNFGKKKAWKKKNQIWAGSSLEKSIKFTLYLLAWLASLWFLSKFTVTSCQLFSRYTNFIPTVFFGLEGYPITRSLKVGSLSLTNHGKSLPLLGWDGHREGTVWPGTARRLSSICLCFYLGHSIRAKDIPKSNAWWAFPGGSVVKNMPANAGDGGSIPGLGRSPGGGNGNPLQYSCLGNPMGRGAWWAAVHGVTKKSNMT